MRGPYPGGRPVGAGWHDARLMLLVVDVGNTQTHFGTFRGDELVEHWRFATVRTSTSDELGAALRNLLELRGVGLADLSASIVSSTVPQLEPEWLAMAEHYLGHRMLAVGPGIRTGMPIKIDNPRELGADRLVNAVASYERLGGPCISVDFGTAVNFDVVSSAGRVHRRRADAGRGDLAGRADVARREAAAHRPGRAEARDREGHGRRDPLRRGLRLRLGRGRPARRASRRSWARRPRRSPPAAWRASSCPTRSRSTSSTSS